MAQRRATTLTVRPDGRVSLPAEFRRRHGLQNGGSIVAYDTGDAIVLRTKDQLTAHLQAMSRELLSGKTGASVDDFLADRQREWNDE